MELMVTVAIIGILASVAIPNYYVFVLRAKRSEAFLCLDGIRSSEHLYEAVNDAFVDAEANPTASPGRSLRPWNPAMPGWEELDWNPTGAVRCSYLVNVYDGGAWFRAESYCDLDGDGNQAILRLNSWKSGVSGGFEDLYPDRW